MQIWILQRQCATNVDLIPLVSIVFFKKLFISLYYKLYLYLLVKLFVSMRVLEPQQQYSYVLFSLQSFSFNNQNKMNIFVKKNNFLICIYIYIYSPLQYQCRRMALRDQTKWHLSKKLYIYHKTIKKW